MSGEEQNERTGKTPEIFVVCAVDSIEQGDARAFSLWRVAENGEARPFPIVIVRTVGGEVYGYVNSCPHQRSWLNIGAGQFFSRDRAFLRCGRHGANFEIDSGLCISGPCRDEGLEPIALAVVDGDICLCGVALVEEDRHLDPYDDLDETMEIMIYPG
jgi:nitrite reductase/ring-hydroxylating ferredoxin subunit